MSGDQALLARRYRRLMTMYPASYRAARGDEILATYLEANAGAARTMPTMVDAFDLFKGGFRQRLRACGIRALIEALPTGRAGDPLALLGRGDLDSCRLRLAVDRVPGPRPGRSGADLGTPAGGRQRPHRGRTA